MASACIRAEHSGTSFNKYNANYGTVLSPHTHTHSFLRVAVQHVFLKPSHPFPPAPSPPTLLLPQLQAVAQQDGQERSELGRLTWMITQSDEEPLRILPGRQERSNTTKASDISLSECVRRCGRREPPLTMR